MGYVYALMVHHLGVNTEGQVGLDFFILRLGDGQLWPKDQGLSSFEPIALYARRATAMRDSTAQVGLYLADIVRRGNKLERPVVRSVPVLALEDVQQFHAEMISRRTRFDAAVAAHRVEHAGEIEAALQAQREARKGEKQTPLVEK